MQIPKLTNAKIRQLQEKLKRMNLKGFFAYDFYEDDETRFLGKNLAEKHKNFIKQISKDNLEHQ